MEIHGKVIDQQTRCIHYNSKLDIIAIKFYCCNKYYPCIYCHQAESHPVKRWPVDKQDEKAVYCGNCCTELSIHQYRSSNFCPNCSASFNPGCVHHFHYYFK